MGYLFRLPPGLHDLCDSGHQRLYEPGLNLVDRPINLELCVLHLMSFDHALEGKDELCGIDKLLPLS